MNAEFNVWLLIVGLVVGAGLVWLVIMDSRRRDAEIDAVERPREAAWLSAVLAEDGYDVSPEAADRLLLLHRAYLDAPPPDGVGVEPFVEDDEATTEVDDDAPRVEAGDVALASAASAAAEPSEPTETEDDGERDFEEIPPRA